jgi:hypothetical protein
MAKVYHQGVQHEVRAIELEPGTLVVMPGGYIGIITSGGRVMSLSDPNWHRDPCTTVVPLRSGDQVTLVQK